MIKALRSGTLIDVDPQTNVATFVTCGWLVQMPTFNPEPDSPSDMWAEVECGARVKTLSQHADHTMCEAGHEYAAYGTPRSLEILMEEEFRNRQG